MCPWCNYGMWGGGTMILWLILIAAIVWFGYRLSRRGPGNGGTGGGSGDSAERLLRERFARGEIDEETYRRMLAQLREH
jgi:putative membrane protein